jgi:L-threonylcarbamoyladenylate synthase
MKGHSMNGNAESIVLPAAAPRAIEWVSERIVDGGVVALPTDTVYGIAASLSHEEALARVFAIKNREAAKTLPILVSSSAALEHLTESLSEEVLLLLNRYWPGPLTVVIPARDGMPPEVTGPGHTIGVRLPNHPLAIEVIERSGGAVACTSANLSGEAPARTADEVVAQLGSELDLVLDGGMTPGGVASTVVAFDGPDLIILRDGPIPAEHLRETWREIQAGR